jgi:hypothetical protein
MVSDMATEKEIIVLAAEEGHDADIPTNEGVVNTHSRHIPNNEFSEKDIEKTAGSLTSASASVHSLNGIKEDHGEGQPNQSNVVDWDGVDDPQNPMNWSNGRKWFAIAVVSAITFVYVFVRHATCSLIF